MVIGTMDGAIGQAARLVLAKGVQLEHAHSVAAGLVSLRRGVSVDLVFCDIRQPVAALVRTLADQRICIPVVACGIDTSGDDAALAIRSGAKEFLPLPPDPVLVAAILESLTSSRPSIIARDPLMLELIRRADLVAGAEASVLLTGASGTGKEMLARHIHQKSRRAGHSFVAINCAAIPHTLLESELFGYEKGAFSGAVAKRVGKFESADGGTLLLDEVTEMDIQLQAKLLRVLQEREIDRLGGLRPIPINVRILATSNRDLLSEIRQGTFREDLYFRLNVVNLRVPALAERIDDISPLANHFAEHYANLNGLPKRPLTDAFHRRLLDYAWPGNVRELENIIHRAVLLATGDEIDIDSLELRTGTTPVCGHNQPARTGASGAIDGLVGRTINDVERELILSTLLSTSGNRTHAAMLLGISIRALRNKLKDYAAGGASVPPPALGVMA
nr:sigma-54 dependent transcriptional regulator [Limobrevibacterium gyesilva]